MSVDFTKIGKEHYRLMIRILVLDEKLRDEIKEVLDVVYSDSFLSVTTAENWLKEFQCGHMAFFKESRPVAQKTVSTEDDATNVHDLALTVFQFSVRDRKHLKRPRGSYSF